MAAEAVELHKLKLAELKQECLARGLETKGIKQDLINRLQAYLEEHAEEEANEEDVLGDETEEEEPKPIELPVKEEEPPEKTVDVAAEKKVVKITSEIPQTERMQKRAERFNVPVSLESKKAARAARFGISSVPSKGLSSDPKPMVNLDKLKERAQRFGLNVSSISRRQLLFSLYCLRIFQMWKRRSKVDFEKLKMSSEGLSLEPSYSTMEKTSEDDEKLKKRKERFGIVTSLPGTGNTGDTEAKKRKRAERFGIA
ncbi:SAP domain-containing ribonucleoprotein isoform X1 [Manis javanica]|uniref:SAP domain-containing ribonucleoprotein isoform X1 n=1 Tax=Manis javanica TaxID=9974 RepID=UPI0008131A4A|nr:SAP domain-containing ribonucleoprotein isoform X1 [Manis javanica]